MSKQGTFLFGVAVGAGIMYLLDPDRGRRRRALIRDQVVRGAHEVEDLGGVAAGRARDLRNRAVGAMHETRARLSSEVVDDPVLEARVRAELGRLTSTPGSIEVHADHGRVVLTGQVPERERSSLLDGVREVRGVGEVVNRLQTTTASGTAGGDR